MNRLFVLETGLWLGVKQFASVHPGLRPFENCPSIRLRDYTFANPETPNVDFVAKALRNLINEVVLVTFRFNIYVGLCPDQSARITLYDSGIHMAGKHKGHHERGGDNFPKAVLLQKIQLWTPHIYRRHLARYRSIDARPRRADKFECDVFGRQEHLQSLQSGIMTPE